jgi:hypothetical protein
VLAVALVPAVSASAAPTYQVSVTARCRKPSRKRQLAPNSCMNYVPDGTQTYEARVTDVDGRPATGVLVHWADSSASARFRPKKNPCTTGSDGTCSDELVVTRPRRGDRITVTATVPGDSALGYLTFR